MIICILQRYVLKTSVHTPSRTIWCAVFQILNNGVFMLNQSVFLLMVSSNRALGDFVELIIDQPPVFQHVCLSLTSSTSLFLYCSPYPVPDVHTFSTLEASYFTNSSSFRECSCLNVAYWVYYRVFIRFFITLFLNFVYELKGGGQTWKISMQSSLFDF